MSPSKKPDLPVDLYIRVSATMGREGESFISPAEQEKACRRELEYRQLKVGQVFTDLDKSGSTQDRPAFNEVMQRIRDGVSGGVVVAKLNRFGRTTVGVIQDIQEIESHGAVFISVEEELNTATSTGRFVLRMFASVAELELDRIKESWGVAHDNMIERGIQAGRSPFGYSRDDGKRLVPDENADTVRELFRRRAEGANWHECMRWLDESGVSTPSGKPWGIGSVRKIIENRVYLGEAKHGERVKKDAHEALVDERTFRLANRKAARVSGERGDGPLLGGGLIRCATCGAAMVKSQTRKGKDGKSYSYLRCVNGSGSGHPTIAYGRTQEYLVREALHRIELSEPVLVDTTVDPETRERLESVVAEIAELDRQLEAGELSPLVYAKAAEVSQREREALQELVDEADPSGYVVQVSKQHKKDMDAARHLLMTLMEDPAVECEPGEIPNARRLLKETLGHVEVRVGKGAVDERVFIAA